MSRDLTPRQIDALIAKHIMGLEVTDNTYAAPIAVDYGVGEGGFDGPLLKYSTDIKAAWEVVEKFDYYIIQADCGRYRVNLTPEYEWYDARAQSVPMAICLAALKAKGVEVR